MSIQKDIVDNTEKMSQKDLARSDSSESEAMLGIVDDTKKSQKDQARSNSSESDAKLGIVDLPILFCYKIWDVCKKQDLKIKKKESQHGCRKWAP